MAKTFWMLTTNNHIGREGPRDLYQSSDEAISIAMEKVERILSLEMTGTMLDHELESMNWQLNGDTWRLIVDRYTDFFVYPVTLVEN